MPYITGTYANFLSRLHQLPTGTGDLNSFCIEGSGYMGISGANIAVGVMDSGKILTAQLLGTWEREARLQFYRTTKSGIYLNVAIFTGRY